MIHSNENWAAKLRTIAGRGELIVGAGAGTGLSAKSAEAGGADVITFTIPAGFAWLAAARWRV